MKLVDNGDCTLTDSESGLMWQAADDGIRRGYDDALLYCADLSLADCEDWRLPTVEEFQTLVRAAHSSGLKVYTTHNSSTNHDYWTATPGPQIEVAYIADGTTMFRSNEYTTRAVRTETYRRREGQFNWTSNQLNLADMLKAFVEKTGAVHGMDIERKVSELGPEAVPILRRLLEVDLNGDVGGGVVFALKGMRADLALPLVGLALTSSYGSVRKPAINYLYFHRNPLAKALAAQRLKVENREDFRKSLQQVLDSETLDS